MQKAETEVIAGASVSTLCRFLPHIDGLAFDLVSLCCRSFLAANGKDPVNMSTQMQMYSGIRAHTPRSA